MYTETKRFTRRLGEHSNHTPTQTDSRPHAGEPRSACRAEEQDEPGSVLVTAVELMTLSTIARGSRIEWRDASNVTANTKLPGDPSGMGRPPGSSEQAATLARK